MRIDFSEPICSNCYHCRTLGVLNTQESEPSNVIGSSVTSMPVSSGPVQALGHDSPVVGSTSTSSPVHSSSAISFGTPLAATTLAISEPAESVAPTISSCSSYITSMPVSTGPVQALGHDSPVVGSASTSYPLKALGHDSVAVGSTSTSSPVHSSSAISFGTPLAATTSVISEPAQSVAPTISSYRAFGCPAFQCGFAPAFKSVSSSPTQALGPTAFGFRAFSAPTPPRFGTMQDPVQASASSTSTPFSFGPAHNFGKPAFGSVFGNGVAFARPDVGYSPVPSSSTTTAVFGATPVKVSSPFAPTQASVQASASSTSTFLPFGPFGGVPPYSASGNYISGFETPPASSSFNLFRPNASTTASVFDTPTYSVCSQFGSEQDFPKTTDSVFASSTEKTPLDSCFPGFGVGYFPGSSSNLFRPNQSTTTPNFSGVYIGGGGVKVSSPLPFGFSAATTVLPSSPFSSSAKFCSNSNICNEQGSRYPGYSPTPDGHTQKGESYISISASDPYLHKSHEELRWEDYKQGVKGGSFPAAHASPISPRPDTVFSPSTVSPSIFNHRSIPHYAYPPTGLIFPSSSSPSSTTVPPINSSVQRPHETAAVPSPAPGCTACGATTSSSASGYFTFNGATTPPSAATYLPGLFFPPSGSVPMMFGTTPAAQATTPALQAYPVQAYILLPFGAMSLQ